MVKRRASIDIYKQLALQVPQEGARAYETVVKRHVGDVPEATTEVSCLRAGYGGLSKGEGTAARAGIRYLSSEEKDTVRVADEGGDGR